MPLDHCRDTVCFFKSSTGVPQMGAPADTRLRQLGCRCCAKDKEICAGGGKGSHKTGLSADLFFQFCFTYGVLCSYGVKYVWPTGRDGHLEKSQTAVTGDDHVTRLTEPEPKCTRGHLNLLICVSWFRPSHRKNLLYIHNHGIAS